VAVDVVCPHCETQFHLKPDMLGKAMRCPECKDIFTVTAAREEFPPLLPEEAPPKEVPYERIEADPVMAPAILDAEPVALLKPAVLLPQLPTAIPLPAKAYPTAIPLPAKARRMEEAEEPGVREVDWRSSAAAPPIVAMLDEPVPAALDLGTPKPKRNPWPLVLTGLIVLIAVLAVGTIAKVLIDRSRQEEILAEQAETSFKDRNFPEAARQFEELLAQYPESAGAERYRFFQSLSALHAAVGSVGLRDDPGIGRAKWDAFLKDHAGSPLAKTDDQNYGVSIFEAGHALANGYANHAEDRLKKYRLELARVDYLAAAEKAVADGLALLPVVERYRDREGATLTEVRTRFDSLSGEFVRERRRLDVLAPYRNLADDPIEERIAEFTAALARTGFSDDAEAKALIVAATLKLRSLLKAVEDFAPPETRIIKDAAERPLVTVANPANRLDPPPPLTNVAPDTFFASARGWLYAFDVDGGDLLWTTRVGMTAAPLRVTLSDGGTEILLVPSILDGQAGLTSREARTGKAIWHQSLPAPIAGTAAVVGSRVYVPLADATGTLVEFDINSGHRLSTFRLRQRIGAGIVRIPDTNLIVVVADARRLFAIDVAPLDANGDRQPMRLRYVLQSHHPELSVRVPPAFCGASKPTLLLVQNEGTSTTRLRAISLPEMPPLPADAAIPEASVTEVARATLPGQATFPPASDGERVAVVTDVGAFGVYRTNAPGNLDRGLFALPASALAQDARDPLPALAAISSEDSTWVFARGKRALLLQSFTPASGFKVVLRGAPTPSGLPMQPTQNFPLRGAVGIVLRAEQSDSCQASLFDIATGRMRWERTLGAIAATTPIASKSGTLLIDDDGGVQKLTPHPKETARAERIAAPIAPTGGSAQVATNADAAWVVVPMAKGRLQVRQILDGKMVFDGEVALPAALAGRMTALGDTVIVPLADGFLYRFDSTAKAFVAGPMWRGNNVAADATCYLCAVKGDELLASDGARRVGRWRWPGGAEWSAVGNAIELRDRIAVAPAALSAGERTLVLVAETNGAIAVLDLERPSEALRRWRPTDDVKPQVPAGRPSLDFKLLPREKGPPLAVYAVNQRHLVALSADQASPAWVISREPGDFDILDMVVSDGMLLVTDLAGTVSAYDGAGQLLGRQQPKSRDLLPRTAAVPFAPDRLALPIADGTVIFLPAFRKANP
jgi:predicted Zn finger-like uncharacterized protein